MINNILLTSFKATLYLSIFLNLSGIYTVSKGYIFILGVLFIYIYSTKYFHKKLCLYN